MNRDHSSGALVLGVFICIGLGLLGWLVSDGLAKFRSHERTVVVKGLAEKEVPADVVIWPIKFNVVGNDLEVLFSAIEEKAGKIDQFLTSHGFSDDDISLGAPKIVDRQAQTYSKEAPLFRYAAHGIITVYTTEVDRVQRATGDLLELGKSGVALTGQDYDSRTEYLYTKLNDIKPEMIAEATRNARQVAEKFAQDSNSRIGKIKRARQGQFSITDRDSNTPHIKKVRVVSTIEYYLAD
jgi:hypothetical protein